MNNGKYDVNDLKKAISESICYTDVCRLLDVTICTYNFKRIQSLCLTHGITTNHFDVGLARKRGKFIWAIENIFCLNSKVPRFRLREFVIKFNIFSEYKCSECGISNWNNKPITIEIDHINGINDDNRIENLRWLCPNCHSQTSTHKNSKNRFTE